MKKIILVLLISFTALLAADYIIKKDGTLTPVSSQEGKINKNTITLIVGDKDAPIYRNDFESLHKAVEKSRDYRYPTKKSILIADGKYFLEKALELDNRDSGLTIEAQQGAEPILYGGRQLTGWKPDGTNFWSVDAPQLITNGWDFRMLSVNGRFCDRSRLPSSGFFENKDEWTVPWMSTSGGGWERQPTLEELTTMTYDPNDLGSWLDVKNAELAVYHMWNESAVGIASMDTGAHTLTFSNPSTNPPGAFNKHNYIVWNVREGMTQAGQWYLDRTRGKVVYWPLPDENMVDSEAIAPTTESIIQIIGSKGVPVQSVAIRGLTLSVTNIPLKSGGFGARFFNGAIQIKYTQDMELTDLTIVNVGGQGIKDYGSQNLQVRRCHVHHTGAGGFIFDKSNQIVEGNHIHHIGITSPGAIALFSIGGEGCRIANNEIDHVPYVGIGISGTGHQIESNLVRYAMQELHDGGGIYITFCKNVTVRGNFVRDIGIQGYTGSGYSAYYLDEHSENCLIEGNLALTRDTVRPSQNHLSTNNTFRNNIFLHDGNMILSFNKSADYIYEKNIFQATGTINLKLSSDSIQMKENVIFSESQPARWAEENNSLDNPHLQHDGYGNITFASDSIAALLGIKEIDVSGAGSQDHQ